MTHDWPARAYWFKTPTAHWQEMCKGCGYFFRFFYFRVGVFLGWLYVFFFSVFVTYMLCLFLGLLNGAEQLLENSGTSVRYQSSGCIASGHLENICADRRSQKFLPLDEFLPPNSAAFALLSLAPPQPTLNTFNNDFTMSHSCVKAKSLFTTPDEALHLRVKAQGQSRS